MLGRITGHVVFDRFHFSGSVNQALPDGDPQIKVVARQLAYNLPHALNKFHARGKSPIKRSFRMKNAAVWLQVLTLVTSTRFGIPNWTDQHVLARLLRAARPGTEEIAVTSRAKELFMKNERTVPRSR
jgi:hypothetical protein